MFDGRSAVELINSASCAAARLVRLNRSGPFNVLCSRGQNVQGVRPRFCGHYYRWCLNFAKGGDLRLYVLFHYLRLSIGAACPVFQRVPAGLFMSIFRVLGVRFLAFLGR